LEKTPHGAGDEIQLTDAIAMLMDTEQVEAYGVVGRSLDCGSKLGYVTANIELALRHPEMGEQVREFIKSLKL
jgi:UTP--glucose-1-phosphate uridylyltransferase